MQVKRTERGWAGHFCAANNCLFRRNTLLEFGETRIVVSTVGNYIYENKRQEIGIKRYFETMAFHAAFDGKYWDADVERQVIFDSDWALGEIDDDNRVNDMHEAVVNEITSKLLEGNKFESEEK